ncbi:MAG TPA: YCF48-related protein [Planctomycetota bacterium]|nr:YCF48-related protein [Planctomycetota bacterium]
MTAYKMIRCASTMVVVTTITILGQADAQAAFHHLQGGRINRVVFTDSENGFAAEDGGRIRYTTDGGETWAFADVPPNIRANLFDIFFLDNDTNTGWVAGDQGIVLKAVASTNGQQWTEATSPSNRIKDTLVTADFDCGEHPAALQGIFMTDSTHGWVIGYDGAIAKTSNGWTTWTRPSSGLPSQIDCSDQPDGPDDLYDIHFFRDPAASTHWLNGIICGDARAYYTTSDGGATWSWNAIPSDSCPNNHYIELWHMAFTDPDDPSSDGWMAGGAGTSAGYLFRTDDGGDSWTQESCFDVLDPSVQEAHNCDYATMYDVAIMGASAQPWGIMGGYGGQTFVRLNSGGSIAGNFNACAEDCSSSCTPSGPIWVEKDTTNDGENHCGQQPPLFGVARISDTRGCVVGMFGRIATFENGASNEIVDRATTYFNRLNDAVFADADYGLAIGQNYQIFLTADGGEYWRNASAWSCGGDSAEGTGIDLSPSGTYGVAVGNAGFVAYSSNSGDSWTQLSSQASPPQIPSNLPDLNAVAFEPSSSSTTAYAVGGSGKVIKSTDSGAHWSSVTSAGSYALNGVSFLDASHGYVAGNHGTVYGTSNGGSSWSAVSVEGSPTKNFNDVVAWGTWGTDGAAAMIVGDDGVIYEKGASDRGFSRVITGLGQTENLYDVEVLSSGTYIRIGGDTGVALFRDSGTWTAPKSQTVFPLTKMAFQSATQGYAIGRNFIVEEYN